MLKVWGRRSSFNVQKVMWLIGELGLAHEHIDAGGRFGGLDTPLFLAMNPHGRVPVIREDDALQPDFLVGVFGGFFRTPEDKRNWPAIRASLSRCVRHFEKLDRLLEGRSFLLGDPPTLADIAVGTSLYRYFELEIERPKLAQVERWYHRLQERPAFRAHVMIPFEELRGRLDY
jgi:glutathione S-transferase